MGVVVWGYRGGVGTLRIPYKLSTYGKFRHTYFLLVSFASNRRQHWPSATQVGDLKLRLSLGHTKENTQREKRRRLLLGSEAGKPATPGVS